jgi:hypothetical protein
MVAMYAHAHVSKSHGVIWLLRDKRVVVSFLLTMPLNSDLPESSTSSVRPGRVVRPTARLEQYRESVCYWILRVHSPHSRSLIHS